MRPAKSRLCVAISAARPVRRTRSMQHRRHLVGGMRDRDCRSARRRAAVSGCWRARAAMATRCCSPPESRPGGVGARHQPDEPQQLQRAARAALRDTPAIICGSMMFSTRREFRQQMVELIDEADRGTPRSVRARSFIALQSAPSRDRAAVGPLQQAGDMQQGRFAGARWPDQRHDLAALRSSARRRADRQRLARLAR